MNRSLHSASFFSKLLESIVIKTFISRWLSKVCTSEKLWSLEYMILIILEHKTIASFDISISFCVSEFIRYYASFIFSISVIIIAIVIVIIIIMPNNSVRLVTLIHSFLIQQKKLTQISRECGCVGGVFGTPVFWHP